MSRIGKKPVPIPKGVTVTLDGSKINVKGPKGELSRSLPAAMLISMKNNEVIVERPSEENEHKALHGLTRTLVANMVEGVTTGFTKRLEIQGVGYRAVAKGTDIEFALGYSHAIVVKPPKGIEFEVPTPTAVVVRGNDKQAVGQIAAEIRALRPPEPYKGKGIRYAGEQVVRKVGKRA